MKSPTLKGLNRRIITPPAKFCSVPLRAMPMATPADANRAMNDEVSMPRMLTMTMMSRNHATTLTMLVRNV